MALALVDAGIPLQALFAAAAVASTPTGIAVDPVTAQEQSAQAWGVFAFLQDQEAPIMSQVRNRTKPNKLTDTKRTVFAQMLGMTDAQGMTEMIAVAQLSAKKVLAYLRSAVVTKIEHDPVLSAPTVS